MTSFSLFRGGERSRAVGPLFSSVTASVVLLVCLVMGSGLAHAQPASRGSQPSLAPMLEDTTPAVVNIAVVREQRMPEAMRFFNERDLRRFFQGEPPEDSDREPPVRRQRGAGSGVIINAEEGHVVTNHHVVDGADTVTVSLQDGRQIEAEVIGSDERTDIALLHIDADDLSELEFADITDLRVGDYVAAIGNPFGIGQTVTTGIVSALGRAGINRENYEDFIQTDAAINVGNSGGALVDLNGRLIGINTAIISGSGASAGIGFAVPVDMVATVVDHLVRDGVVQRGQLGVLIRDYTPQMEETLQLGTDEGALVTQVMEDSAAEAAGMEVSDVVVEINGEDVRNSRDLRNAVGLIRTGETVDLVLYRDGERVEVSATITSSEDGQVASSRGADGDGRALQDTRFHGAQLQNTSGDGVQVAGVQQNSRAWASGLRPGDRIIAVNRNPVADLGEFNEIVSDNDGVAALGVIRDGRRMLIVLP
ncbi:MAG: Do family serine endopeptidase [Pseudohongiellaceae bacterium]